MAEKMTEKVIRLSKMPERIRNIAICAHIDHGKTTFSDNLLAGAGMMSEELAGKALQLDFHTDEQERGITIDSAAVSMVHDFENEEYLINLIDTPGHVDFGGDVTRAMRAVDGTIVLVCAVEGMMPQTETVLRQALRERVKPILFINKVDRLIKELKLTPEGMQQRFVKIISDVNKFMRGIVPPEFREEWKVKVEDGSVCFGSAFHNWGLSVPYMQKAGISFKDIISAYEENETEAPKILRGKAPLHRVVLNAVIRHLPAPKEAQPYRISRIWHGDLNSETGKALVECDPKGALAFEITKIVVDPNAGEIATGRIFSGTARKGQLVHVAGRKEEERLQQIYVYRGAKKDIVNEVPAGNIIGIAGIKAFAGDTITDSPEMVPFEHLKHIFDPVITKAVEPKNPSELPKLVDVLRQTQKEDPSIVVTINEETGEYLISGMGELHLEVIENRIKTDKHLEIKSSPPIVVYRESITKASKEFEGKSPNKHNKLYFKVEPLPDEISKKIKEGEIYEGRVKKKDDELITAFVEAGMDNKEARRVRDVYKGNILVDGTRGIVHIGEIIEMVMDMFEDVMGAAPLAREPAINIKVVLTDAKLHEDSIHRGPAQIYPAVREGIRGAIMDASPVMLEPIQTLRFECPADYVGEVSKLIGNKRGQMLDMQQEGNHAVVLGKLPVAEMFGLSSELRSATGGRGTFSLVDQNFEIVPYELQDEVIRQIRARKGLKLEEDS
ncbi:MAG: elongation factor 2 [Candidatus Woesearchaeota archaeon]|nr:elongation factor 2 [Candidatus Woesearchaeota archaeon]